MVAGIDTLKLTKRLRGAGFTEDQAEALTEAIKEAQSFAISELATKSDLIQQRSELQEYINNVKAELQESINNVRSELQESINGVRNELQESIGNVRSELQGSIAGLKGEIQGVRSELQESINGVRGELHESIGGIRSELHKSIKRVELRVESLEGDVKLLKWMMGFMLAGILSLIIKAFF